MDNSKSTIFVRLEDVLALLPTNDIAGPKPSYLREQLAELPRIHIPDDVKENEK